jgi:hypothetical protein
LAKRQNQRYFSRKNGERNGRYSQKIYSRIYPHKRLGMLTPSAAEAKFAAEK